MGIVNRTLDASEQKEAFSVTQEALINSDVMNVKIIERPCTIQQVRSTCLGISGAPTGQLRVNRFGSGTFVVGMSFLIPSYGVSGAMAALSLPAAGATTLNLLKDDLLYVTVGGGTGAAADAVTLEVVVQNIQDIKSWY